MSMKRFVIILAVLSFLILVGSVTGIANAVGDSLLFYVRVARLYSKDPPAKIKMPLPGISKKQIANTWHAPRGADRLHQGQDIFAARGTPVYSATNGYVYNIGENRLGGQTVSVIGAGGRVYYYAHLDSYAAGIGRRRLRNATDKTGFSRNNGQCARHAATSSLRRLHNNWSDRSTAVVRKSRDPNA